MAIEIPDNNKYVLFGGNFLLANKMQLVGDKRIHGTTIKQWFLMRMLASMPTNPPPTITSLAKETDTTRQNATKILEILAREGLVELGNNPSDKRSHTVRISEKGRQWQAELTKQAQPFLAELFAGISDDECAAAAKVLIKMMDNLNKMQEEL